MTERWDRAVAAGIGFLAGRQTPDGGFAAKISAAARPFKPVRSYPTVFNAALILDATTGLAPDEKLGLMQSRLAAYLTRQASEAGTFNYLPRGSAQAQKTPYPDDLDDTVISLAALGRHDPELLGPGRLAAAVRLLTALETQVGGPYRTWVVPETAAAEWRDIDLGVNCNVAYFLGLQGVKMPRLDAMMEAAITNQHFTTPYYMPSELPVLYFLARSYNGPLKEQLRASILRRRSDDGSWGSAFETALGLSALVRTGGTWPDVAPAAERLLAAQVGGGWPAGALCREFGTAGGAHFAGAESLTTALGLEALNLARAIRPEAVNPGPSRVVARSQVHDEIYTTVVKRVGQRLDGLDESLRAPATAALERQLGRDTDRQIVLLPAIWEAALKPARRHATYEQLITLGMANLYGWLAYTTYDDFLDDEGQPSHLPAANLALRELVGLFGGLSLGLPGAEALLRRIMDRVDTANAWEVQHCRGQIIRGRLRLAAIPDYGDLEPLAGRSIGHALGPMYCLMLRGHTARSAALRRILEYFEHYLIARQLNDDAHDWEADLARGHINAVGALLLRRLPGEQKLHKVPLAELIKQLKEQFWTRDIEEVCGLITLHTAAAREALGKIPEIINPDGIAALLEPLDQAAATALRERDQTLAFLEAYRNPTG